MGSCEKRAANYSGFVEVKQDAEQESCQRRQY